MTGKENFPSERSSAKPLFDVYWRNNGLARHEEVVCRVAYLGALQIHQIVADLKEHTNQVYEGNIVPIGC